MPTSYLLNVGLLIKLCRQKFPFLQRSLFDAFPTLAEIFNFGFWSETILFARHLSKFSKTVTATKLFAFIPVSVTIVEAEVGSSSVGKKKKKKFTVVFSCHVFTQSDSDFTVLLMETK